ncbi:hypothetical protein GYMLUDRAFT_212939 [Collybiopsis luxurians FD-317 M1]|nr:hypothetical protein GYMLUDRAFT_212939 [Collybiopsis luxurians FD-317 M1]
MAEKQLGPSSPRKTNSFRSYPTRFGCLAVVGLCYWAISHSIARHASLTLPPTGDWHELERKPSMSTEEKEALFLSVPNSSNAIATARQYSKHPHLAGSPQDHLDALSMLEFFQTELGISPPHHSPVFSAGTPKSRAQTIALTSKIGPRNPTAWVDVYYPYLDTPLDRSLDILDDAGNSVWSADLREDGNPLDEDAAKYRDAIPAWHGLSGPGEGLGQLVYVNYGTYEDYEEVLASGHNLTGKVVIARYGALFRGLKVKRAEELGAAAVLIYSDPRDDGYVTVGNGFAAYPDGPARNPTSLQRGSSMYLSSYPGDPQTPGRPAYENAEREEAKNVPKIPSLPISWANAQRLLEEIGEIYLNAGVDERRKLSGKTSTRKIKVVNNVDRKITPIWNTMAAIPGHVRNEVVILGCHRDAWVLGAADPVSGTVSLTEIVRGLGALLRQGWRPLRTILIASWDAEEHGLVGSTEQGEDFAEWISEHAVAYLNVDVSSSGSRWNVISSPSLAHLIRRTALDVPHPSGEKGKTLWDARNDEGPFKPFGPLGPDGRLGAIVAANHINNSTVFSYRLLEVGKLHADADVMESYEAGRKERGTGVGPMGSGSDYTVFLQRLGVASADQGFATTPYDAPYHYHSIYDSMRWQEVYADPGFKKHLAVAKHLGLLTLRVTDSIIIPLNTTQYAYELHEYLDKVEALLPSLPNEDPSALLAGFSSLRQHIKKLQEASILLDIEKAEAEKRFRELLSKMPSFPGARTRHSCQHRGSLSRWIRNLIKHIFEVRQQHDEWFMADSWESLLSTSSMNGEHDKIVAEWLRHLSNGHLPDLPDVPDLPSPPSPTSIPSPPKLPSPPPIYEFIRAAKRVSRANHKLIFFERGFIDEEGIKHREWYRHLGVAPGAYLGYGATTFPALTEAITIDKNITAAAAESQRLVKCLKEMIEGLRV